MQAALNHLTRALLVTILAAPQPATAGPKEDAQAHIANAMEAHGKNDFATALKELEAAYKLDPMPDLLYAIGQVYVKLDRCPEAIGYYERYLATKPGVQATADTKEAIETCKLQAPSATPVKPDAGQPPPSTAPPATPPPSPEPSPEPPPSIPPADADLGAGPVPWYKNRIGGALVLSGVAASAIGLVLYTGARGDLDDAEKANNLTEYNDLVDGAKSKRTFAVVLGVGGMALLGAGVYTYLRHEGGSNHEARGVGVAPARGGGLVTWGGTF